MALRKARTVDQLATLTQHYDTVLTTDAPLALALNRRTDDAQLGTHATTPKNWARQRHETVDRRELFHTLTQETNIPWKQAATLLDACLRCWEHTGQRDAILNHDRYNTPQTRQILGILATQPSPHKARQQATLDPAEKIALIDPDSFTTLDQAILPDDTTNLDTISPFEPNTHTPPPPFHVLPSTPAILQTLQTHITPQTANDIGIVVNPNGPLRPLIESLLDAQNIPYSKEDELDEDPTLRALLRLLRLSLTPERIKARHLRGALATLDYTLPPRDDEKLLTTLTSPTAQEIQTFFQHLQNATLQDALQRFETLTETPLTNARELFEDLQLLNEPIDQPLLDAIAYYLDTFRIREDYTRDGVLLASAHQNATVDRPLVFHLGLDAGWTQPLPQDPWITPQDHEARQHQDLARFERLIQAGTQPIALVQDTREGKPLAPCFALHELLDADFERFTQLPTAEPKRAPHPDTNPQQGFTRTPLDKPEPDPFETLSPTALDTLTHCPRAWYMDQLVHTPDAEPLARGRILHDFAEFYAAHPEQVDLDNPDDVDTLLQIALNELAPYLDPDDEATRATELKLGLRMIARWLDEHPPTGDLPDGYTDPPPTRQSTTENPFAKAYEAPIEATTAERWFTDPTLGLHGKVDLIQSRTHLVDWKTGKNPPSLGRTLRQTRPSSNEDTPKFQPAAYLAHHRACTPNTQLTFTYVDILSNTTELIQGQASLDAIERALPYYPHSLEDHLASRDVFDHLISTSQERKDVLETLTYDRYKRHMQRHGPPPLDDKTTAAESAFADTLTDLAIQHRGAPKTSENAIRSSMRKLAKLPETALFKEDLDAFEHYVHAMLEAVNNWLTTRFPTGDTHPRDTHHEDLILTHLGPEPDTLPPTPNQAHPEPIDE